MKYEIECAIEAGLRFRPKPHEGFWDYRKRLGRDAAARDITSDALLTIFEGFEWIRTKEEEEGLDEYRRQTLSIRTY